MTVEGIVVRIVSGDNQSAEANQRVSDPLVVEATRGGRPAQNEAVRFHISGDDGTIGLTPGQLGTVLETRTGPNGWAALPVWVLGASGSQRVVARVGTPPLTSISFRATALPPRVALEPVSGPTPGWPSGSLESYPAQSWQGPLIVRLRRGATPIAGERVTFVVTSGGGRIGRVEISLLKGEGHSEDSVFELGPRYETRTGARGVASCPTWQLGDRPGRHAVEARVGEPYNQRVEFAARVPMWMPPIIPGAGLPSADAPTVPPDANPAGAEGGRSDGVPDSGVVERTDEELDDEGR